MFGVDFLFLSSLFLIEVPPCTVAHFKKVRKNQKATVTKVDLQKFDAFTKEFGFTRWPNHWVMSIRPESGN
uniref:Spastin/Vps4 C-terminal domain-containing protein n=1 Tax=Quercus lobata TaxID=97700 RepID=A0A7N2LJQ6_QUELO